MILGLRRSPALTLLHVAISLIGIASGIVFVAGRGRPPRCWPVEMGGWTSSFVVTTILDQCLPAFFFPSKVFGPPHVVGVISLVILAAALLALRGGWRSERHRLRRAAALYLNAFVGVVQAFDKIAPLRTPPSAVRPPAGFGASITTDRLSTRTASSPSAGTMQTNANLPQVAEPAAAIRTYQEHF